MASSSLGSLEFGNSRSIEQMLLLLSSISFTVGSGAANPIGVFSRRIVQLVVRTTAAAAVPVIANYLEKIGETGEKSLKFVINAMWCGTRRDLVKENLTNLWCICVMTHDLVE